MRWRVSVRPGAFLFTILALVVAALAVPASFADTGTPPAFDKTLGGPGHAETYPSGLEVGPDGTIVLADTGNDNVSKYNATTGARVWRTGSTPGTASVENPRDVGIDSSGNIYVADEGNFQIVKLTAAGALVGSPWKGPNGDRVGSPIGVSVKNNLVYVADGSKKKVRVFNTDGTQIRSFGSQGACTFAALRDVDADAAGNVYVANYTNNNILKMTSTGTCTQAWGTKGTGNGQFKNPYGVRVAMDPQAGAERVYVADSNNNRIQVFTTMGGYVAQLGAAGPPTSEGTFTTLRRVAVADDGDVWGADLWGFRAERFDRTPAGYVYAQTIGNGPPPLTPTDVFNEPRGIGFDSSGNLVIADSVNQQIVRMNATTGAIPGTCGERTSSPASLNWPRGVAVDQATGNIWVADTKQSRLQIFSSSCAYVAKVGTVGAGNSQFNWPHSIAIRQSDHIAWVADTKNNRIVSYNVATRALIAVFGTLGTGSTQFNQPRGIAVAPDSGHILVADTMNNRIVELADNGGSSVSVVRSLGTGLNRPEGVAADSAGRIYIADTGNNRVVILNANGTTLATITAAAGAPLQAPANVAVNPSGKLYVADTQADRILVFAAYGGVVPPGPSTIPQYTGNLLGPSLADMYPVDIASTATHYYVVDPGRYRVVSVNRSTGAISNVAGGHQGNSPGSFAAARAINVDSLGNVYVADTPNNRISKFNANLGYLTQWGTKGTGPGQFSQVYGVATGMGKGIGGAAAEVVYTVDAGRVQKFTLGGTWLATFGAGSLSQPRQIAVHPTTGFVYVVSARDRQVVVFNQDGAQQFRFGSEGSGNGQFTGDPRGITIGSDGTVFVTDDGNRRVEAFNSTGLFLYHVGGPGTGAGQFTDPRGLDATNDGKLIVTDEWDFSLKEFQANGTYIRKLFGAGPPGAGVNSPRGLDVDSTGRVYTSDWWNQRINRVNTNGSGFFTWGQRGTRNDVGSINFAWDVAVQPGTGRVFVANRENHEIEVFTSDGAFVTRWGNRGADPGQMEFPQGAAFAPNGNLLVSDSGNNRVDRFSIDSNGNGTFVEAYGSLGTAPGQFKTPTGIDVAADGTIWVADTLNNRVQKRSPAGAWTAFIKAGLSGSFRAPWGVTVAPDGTIWTADSGNDRIVKMTSDAALLFTATGPELGAGTIDAPFDIAFGTNGHVYVSDTWNNRVIELAYP